MNLVILTGRLGADIDVQSSKGTDYAHFSLASNYRVKVGDEYEERVTWTRVTAFNGLARSLGILGKGSLVGLRGHLKTAEFEEGDVRLCYSEVVADRVEFLEVRKPTGAEATAEDTPEEGVTAAA